MHDRFTANWWETLYDDLVAGMLLAQRSDDEVARITDFLIQQLNVSPGATVYDQCCGIGTLSVALAHRGLNVVGVDQSAAYIAHAERAAVGLPCTFAAHDCTTHVPAPPVAAVVNWGTSFGNHLDDARNRQMLQSAYDALQPGGRIVVDYQHLPRVLRDWQRTLTYRQATPAGDVVLLRESTLDLPAGALRQRWTFFKPDGTRTENTSAVRLYWPHDIGRLLGECGFVDVTYFGDVTGTPLLLDSPRCIVVARRP